MCPRSRCLAPVIDGRAQLSRVRAIDHIVATCNLALGMGLGRVRWRECGHGADGEVVLRARSALGLRRRGALFRTGLGGLYTPPAGFIGVDKATFPFGWRHFTIISINVH
jgi:hypothetical protein